MSNFRDFHKHYVALNYTKKGDDWQAQRLNVPGRIEDRTASYNLLRSEKGA